jgi:starch synthase
MKTAVAAARATREGIIWIGEMIDNPSKIELYSHAAVFVCPSIYEPFGIINLEAMACGVPVVASAVGGIPEVVVEGETGYLIPIEQMTESPYEPIDPEKFAADLAARINELMSDPAKRRAYGAAGRQRALDHFSWSAIARQTQSLYRSLLPV